MLIKLNDYVFLDPFDVCGFVVEYKSNPVWNNHSLETKVSYDVVCYIIDAKIVCATHNNLEAATKQVAEFAEKVNWNLKKEAGEIDDD